MIENGRVAFDVAGKLPDGTKVRLLPEDEWDDEVPEPQETYEEWLQSLRDAYEDCKAGMGRPAKEVFDELS